MKEVGLYQLTKKTNYQIINIIMATLTGTYVTVNIPGGSSLEVDSGYVGEIFQLVKTDNSCYTFVVQEGTVTLTPNGFNANCTPDWRRLWNLNG